MTLGEKSAVERRARATQRITALGEMTGGIAHDFRNILAVIESALRVAERSPDQPDKVRTCIVGAREGVARGLQLTSQLLAFAKHQELNAHGEDANECLENLELFLKYGGGPGIQIILELASELPKCVIDPAQFNAALLNLVVNARDAMPNGGQIRISTERVEVNSSTSGPPEPGIYVRVRVKDNGQGMSEETLREVFDPLFTTKGEKGTGLGLPQVRSFMRLIGGHASIVSEVGRGTTFDLLFPSAEPDGITEDRNRSESRNDVN